MGRLVHSRAAGRSGGDAPVGLAGPGAPLVAEFSVAEFAAAVGLGAEQGRYYLGHALELAHRLPRLWAQVMGGQVPAWKARRVANATISATLTMEAAGSSTPTSPPSPGGSGPPSSTGSWRKRSDGSCPRWPPDDAATPRPAWGGHRGTV